MAGGSSSVIVARPDAGVIIVGLAAEECGDVATGLPGGRLMHADDSLRLLLCRGQCGRGHRGRGLGERATIVGGGGDLGEGPLLAVPGHLPVEAAETVFGRV